MMSDKAEELAAQLLEKTENGKLRWHSEPGGESETYKTELEDELSFWIKRKTDGDDKVILFSLTGPKGTVLSKSVDNILSGVVRFGDPVVGKSAFPKVNQFRLFSNLFHAARKTAIGKDQTIEKAQLLLERLG
jgi:hypothetical protein